MTPSSHRALSQHDVTSSSRWRFFFVHVMKAGGTSLIFDLEANFAPHEVYPDPRFPEQMELAKTTFFSLARLPPERVAAIRNFNVHLPFCAAELVGPDVVIITILREPVERVISHIKHAKRHVPGCAALTLQQIYEIPWLFRNYFDNHQARIFSVRLDDPIDAIEKMVQRHAGLFQSQAGAFSQRINDLSDAIRNEHGWPFELDASRMQTARANLGRVHVLGLLDRYDELLATLERDYGLKIAHHPPLNVGHDEPVSDELRFRIARDNQRDIEFYAFARELYERRRSPAGRGPPPMY